MAEGRGREGGGDEGPNEAGDEARSPFRSNRDTNPTRPNTQSFWLQLLTFIQAEGSADITTAAHGAALARRAAARLHALAAARTAAVRPLPPLGAGITSSADGGAADLAARLTLASPAMGALLAASVPPRRPRAPPCAPADTDPAGRKRYARGAPKPPTTTAADRWAPASTMDGGGGGPRRAPLADTANTRRPGGFQSARAALAADGDDGFGGALDGEAYSSGAMFPGGAGAFHAGQRGPAGRGGGAAPPPSSSDRAGFVPPMVARALAGPPAGRGGGGGGGGGATNQHAPAASAAAGNADGVLSDRTLRLLALPDGSLPDALARLDPKTIEIVCNEVLDASPSVSWDDIAGQDAAKAAVQELAVWPTQNPGLFVGARAPPRGLLLFGPPGTGKTLLGRAVASNVEAAFFSISASSLTSKWVGEGEKLVRALFAVASALAPAVVFIDEVDSLLTARGGDGEHEASRRLKTELLVQMEGAASKGGAGAPRVLIIGATNRPEELDEAARRRLPKQLYVPLPCAAARRAMLDRALGLSEGGGGGATSSSTVATALSPADLDRVVAKTDGYSGSDVRALISEACAFPVRDALAARGVGATLTGLTPADLRPVTLRDFAAAARAVRPSVEPGEVARYEAYDEKHGARCGGEASGGRGGSGGGEVDMDDW